MARRDNEAPMRARVPANVERQDSILFGFTFRQVVILTIAGLIIYAAWTALARVVHPLAFLIGAIPLAGFAFVLAVGRRDGISLDAWLAHAIRHRRAPHRLVPTGDAIGPAPAWVQTTTGRGDTLPLPAPPRLPAKAIPAHSLVDPAPDRPTPLGAASTGPVRRRTPADQHP